MNTLATLSPALCSNCQSRIDADVFICPRCGFPRRPSAAAWSPEPVSMLETPQARRRDLHLGAIVFTAVVVLGFWILNSALKLDLLPSVHARHLDGAVYAVLGAAFLIVLWVELTLDRH